MIFEITPDFLSANLSLVAGLFGDFLPFFLLIVGLFLGFFILEEIVGWFADWREGRRVLREHYAEIEMSAEQEVLSLYLKGFKQHEREVAVAKAREELIQEA